MRVGTVRRYGYEGAGGVAMASGPASRLAGESRPAAAWNAPCGADLRHPFDSPVARSGQALRSCPDTKAKALPRSDRSSWNPISANTAQIWGTRRAACRKTAGGCAWERYEVTVTRRAGGVAMAPAPTSRLAGNPGLRQQGTRLTARGYGTTKAVP
jgi:hypothetical protein